MQLIAMTHNLPPKFAPALRYSITQTPKTNSTLALNHFNLLVLHSTWISSKMETIVLNARDYPAHAYTVFFDRAEAKREFSGIKLAVLPSHVWN